MNIRQLDCCGLQELADIYRAGHEGIIQKVYEALHEDELGGEGCQLGDCASFVFTQASKEEKPPTPRYGDRFAAFIKRKGFGDVTVIESGKNPNSKKFIRTFLWKVNWEKLIEHCKAKGYKHYEPYSWY